MGVFGQSTRRVLAMVALVLSTVAVMASASVGAQGNSDAAHACQKGGYANLQGADGTRFSNVGACVSYAAHGGTLMAIPTATTIPTATLVPTEVPTEVPTATDVPTATEVPTDVPTQVPAQNLTVTFAPSGSPQYCAVIVTLTSYPANTNVPVTLIFSDQTYNPFHVTMLTDSFGDASGTPVGTYYNLGPTVDVTAGGLDTGPVRISC